MTDGIVNHLYHASHRRYARSGYRAANGYELDDVLNVSLLVLVTFGVLPPMDARVVETIEAIRRQLLSNTLIGGVARDHNH